MRLHINLVGSGRNEGFNLPAYLDIALIHNKRDVIQKRDGRIRRYRLPRFMFHRTRFWKFGS